MKRLLLFVVALIFTMSNAVAVFYVGNLEYRIDTDGNACLFGYRTSAHLGDVEIPSVVLYDGKKYDVTSIDNTTFYNCTTIESVVIPASVTTIGDGAFNGCTNLVSVTINGNGLKKISPWVFANTGITSMVIPESVTELRECVFRNCKQLKNLELNSTLTSVPGYLCCGCESLTSIRIPKGVETICDNAFQDCNLYEVEIPEKVSKITWEVFKGNKNITKVTTRILEPYDIKDNNFEQVVYDNAILSVPVGTTDLYKKRDGWKKFFNLNEEDQANINNPISGDAEIAGRYSLDGKITKSNKGITIIKYSDGRAYKVIE